MASIVSNFYKGVTKKFNIEIKLDGVIADIRNDEVRCLVKNKITDTDANALIDVTADVTTNGIDGIAKFTFSNTDTDVTIGNHVLEVKWTRQNGEEYVLVNQKIACLQRVGD